MWARVTDTERMNRAAGMSSLELTPHSGKTAARYVAKTVLGGFDVDFEEAPFEWKEQEVFESLRRMRSGPALEVRTRFEFAPREGGGSTVTIKVSVVPRVAILRPVVSVATGQTVRGIERAIERMDREGAAPPVAPSAVSAVALERAMTLLALSDKDLVSRLVALMREGDDATLARIRPYELADGWGVERKRVLITCLEAVGAGLLELRWDIICPSCRTASSRVSSLTTIPESGHCQLCEISFELNLDRAIEATFAPHPSVREVKVGPYCIGGPARTPHVYSQGLMPEQGRVTLAAPPAAGAYTLFVRGGATAAIDVAEGAPSSVSVIAEDGLTPRQARVAPGGAVTVENRGAGDRHVKIERLAWHDVAASAHEVSLLGTFRRQFSADVLRAGTALRVTRVGLLFSDLTASTALYACAGDASAFKLVSDHFELLREIIERHHGTVVKTMGDAVMAAFSEELEGIAACSEMLEAFYRFRFGRDFCDDVFLKLGFHVGQSFVVNANNSLDYFGQTVNIAARLQAKAESSELVADAALVERAEKAGSLRRLDLIERFDATLKGVAAPLPCARLVLAADIAQSVRMPSVLPGVIMRAPLAR
jgi:class 3 adenylate cyclase